MAEFEQLQQLWQAQSTPLRKSEAASLADALRRYTRRQNRIGIAKLAIITIILSSGFYRAWHHSAWVLGGLSLVAAGAVWALIADWRSQRAIAGMDFTAPSAAFLRDAIARLRVQWNPFGSAKWAFLGCMVAGMNLILVDAVNGKAPVSRMLWHGLGSVLPLAGYRFGLAIRRRRFEAECRPLIERLAAVQSGLEEWQR